MSSPWTLKILARRSLLKNETLVISALNKLPMELFPPLFKDAFIGKQKNILKAMVAAWPFTCLPLGALMKIPDLEILKAVLGGLDLLFQQKDRPRSCKLEVIDFRDAHHTFWNVWAEAEDDVCSPDVVIETQPVVHHPVQQGKQVLTVVINLSLKSSHLCQYQEYFNCWVQKRKDVLQVICETMEFGALPFYNPLQLLDVFEPNCIQKLEVNAHWDLRTLAKFAPGLGQMRNLQKLFLSEIFTPFEWLQNHELKLLSITEIISQFSQLTKLQYLHLNAMYFLFERLDQVLRYLESPLKTLAITCCMLSDSDLSYLSQYPRVHQLTHLDLSGVNFINLSHPLLGRLLEKLRSTLKTLKLKGCLLKDLQINVLLPALSQCSQLVEVNFAWNLLSVSSLKNLLKHTANLRQLTLETYPAPEEVYNINGYVQPDRFSQCCSELLETLRGIRQPKKVYFLSKRCINCGEFCVYGLEASLCSCVE